MQDPEVVAEVAKVSKLVNELDQSLVKLRNDNVRVGFEWSSSPTSTWVVKMGNVNQQVNYENVRAGIKETGMTDD
jgi:hypothetical protein